MLSFALFGLCGPRHEQSRLTEIVSLIQTTAAGALVLVRVTYFHDAMSEIQTDARPNIVRYWVVVAGMVIAGRIAVRFTQRRLLLTMVDLRNTLMVGWSKCVFGLCDMAETCPALGYRLSGFIQTDETGQGKREHYKSASILGEIRQLLEHIQSYDCQKLLIGIDTTG
jgi:FlaA1/EpsC-like NDP-sugar epimerase